MQTQENQAHIRESKDKKVRFVSVFLFSRKEAAKEHRGKVKPEFTLLPQISPAFLKMRKWGLHRHSS